MGHYTHCLQRRRKMNIQELINGQTLFVVSPAELKEFALAVVSEANKQTAEANRLYTASEFARLHGVDGSTLWRWRKAGILKATKIGGNLYYKEQDLRKEVE